MIGRASHRQRKRPGGEWHGHAAGRARRGHRALDEQGRRAAVPVAQGAGRAPGAGARHHPVRARLVDGVAADLRPRRAGARRLLGDGLVRAPRLRHLVRRHGRVRPVRQVAEHQLRHLERRRRPLGGSGLHRDGRRAGAAPGLRHLVGRATRRPVRRAAAGPRRPSRPRRHGMDGRGQPDARRSQEAPARISRQEPPADRPRLRALDLHPRSSRHGRRCDDRGVRRRDPGARRFRADRHLCRHVLEAAAGRSGEDRGGDHRHARRV